MTPAPGPRPEVVGHEGFPGAGEGPHWLRWIDGVDLRGRGTGSPIVHAHLSPLPPGPRGAPLPRVEALAAVPGARPCAVHAGTLPLLRLGTVFEAGVAMGSVGMEPRTFAFDRGATGVARRRRFDESPAEKPHWWRYAFATLPPRAYSLEGAGDAHCLVLTAGAAQLVLPASEVFRVFLALEPRLADALLSGPWESVGRRVVNESWTERLPDHWEIGLRTGFTGASALAAAAIELTARGRAVADLVHTAVVRSRSPLRSLEADVPLDWTSLELDVEGLRFPARSAVTPAWTGSWRCASSPSACPRPRAACPRACRTALTTTTSSTPTRPRRPSAGTPSRSSMLRHRWTAAGSRR